MSLATRCTACGTVFRVVRDQLRVSEGWVRCGRCEEVFNALDHLFDLEREAPPPWPAVPAVATAPAAEAPVASAAAASGAGATIDLERDPLLHQETEPQTSAGAESAIPSESALEHSTGFADARFASSWLSGDGTQPADDAQDTSMPHEAAPEFVRRAQALQRNERPAVRAAWWLSTFVLLLAFAGQAGYHFRDWIVALWPQTRPAMQALCETAGCRIEPLRCIDSVAVESSGLTRVAALDAYKLSVVLRNRSGIPVALPSLDLSLTDPQGKLVARRVLSPAELGTAQRVLAPGSEAPLQATLVASDQRVLGYTVEIFYP
jgi:predicted Zn finger-like uncharacterized protein